MEQKNQEQANVQTEQPVENKKSVGTKVKNFLICTGKVLVVAGLGFVGGVLASKYGYVNKEQHSLAQAQKTFLDRKNGNN